MATYKTFARSHDVIKSLAEAVGIPTENLTGLVLNAPSDGFVELTATYAVTNDKIAAIARELKRYAVIDREPKPVTFKSLGLAPCLPPEEHHMTGDEWTRKLRESGMTQKDLRENAFKKAEPGEPLTATNWSGLAAELLAESKRSSSQLHELMESASNHAGPADDRVLPVMSCELLGHWFDGENPTCARCGIRLAHDPDRSSDATVSIEGSWRDRGPLL